MKQFLYVLLLLLAVACKTDDYLLYEDYARLQFGPEPDKIYNTNFKYADTLKTVTFVYYGSDVTRDTIFYDIYTIGRLSGKDQPFKIKQVNLPDSDNAQPGVHYLSFDDPTLQASYVIKANTNHAKVPVIALRNASLKQKEFTLCFQIEANGNYQAGEADFQWRKLVITDRLTKPNSWNDWLSQYKLGKYSMVKHAWMIEQTKLKWDEKYLAQVYADMSLSTYWGSKLKELLYLYNHDPKNPNTPLKDENGDLVEFP
ncbi:MAG: DUF4843 domain-containing protein [Bacteroidales bacterium]|nr:DUF4843 domain-containing protein [Bacteroidales bacterium]